MAATVGTTGFGTLLKVGNGASTEIFSTIAEVKSISGPSLSMEMIDATHMESENGYREMLPSFKSAGEVTFEVNFLPSTSAQTKVTTDFIARTKRNFKLLFPNTGAGQWSFSGYYTGFTPSTGIGDMLSASVTITVTGGVTMSM